MTLTEAQTMIHYFLEGDTEVPSSSDDDWTIRTQMINDAIDEWGQKSEVQWRELYTISTSDLEGDGSTKAFTLPTNFNHLTGNVLLYDTDSENYTSVPQISPEEAHLYLGNVNDKKCYISGTRTLTFTIAPGDGVEIHVPYYKNPTHVSSGADVLPMSKPRFCVYWVTAMIGKQSDDYARYNADMARADEMMTAMMADNETLGSRQQNIIPDNYGGFGV